MIPNAYNGESLEHRQSQSVTRIPRSRRITRIIVSGPEFVVLLAPPPMLNIKGEYRLKRLITALIFAADVTRAVCPVMEEQEAVRTMPRGVEAEVEPRTRCRALFFQLPNGKSSSGCSAWNL